MQRELDEIGLDFVRFAAIDGATCLPYLMQNVDRQSYERNMGQSLLPGKVGCYYSHLAIWRELAVSDHPVGLILEDDVVFHKEFNAALDAALAEADQWDLLRLNATRARFPVLRGRAGRWQINGYLGRFTGNGAYLIKASQAARISSSIGTMRWSFEYEIGRFFEHNYRFAGLEPFPSHIEDYGESQIVGTNNAMLEKQHWLRRLPHFGQKVASYIRRWKHLNSSDGWPKHKK